MNNNNKNTVNKMNNKKEDDEISAFSNFDITEIQQERNIEKEVKEKLDVVRKLYHKAR